MGAARRRKAPVPAGPTPEQIQKTAERAALVARAPVLHPSCLARITLDEISTILLLDGVEGLTRAHVEFLLDRLTSLEEELEEQREELKRVVREKNDLEDWVLSEED